jgi:hypothetical protein
LIEIDSWPLSPAGGNHLILASVATTCGKLIFSAITPQPISLMSFVTLPLLLIIAQAGQTEFPAPSTELIRVDRGLQVVVFPERVRLQYDLALNAPAVIALLDRNSHELPDIEDRRALMEAFRDVALSEIQRRCRITVNGSPLAWRVVETRIFPKHYVQLAFIFEAPLPVAGDFVRLRMVDGSFRGCDGNHLIALKTGNGAQLQSSSVPLILARVPRQSLSNDSAAQREAARRAEAVVQRNLAPTQSANLSLKNPPVKPLDAEKRANTSPLLEDPPWMKPLWVAGCCVGIIAFIMICWRRIR